LAIILAACTPPGQQLAQEESQNYYLQGMDRLSEGKYLAATVAFERALQRNPDFREAHFQLGTTYHHQPLTNYVYALYHLQRCIDINPRDPDAISAEQQIQACKIELIKGVPIDLALVDKNLTKNLENAQTTIKGLRAEIAQLKASTTLANGGQQGNIRSSSPPEETQLVVNTPGQPIPTRRTHIVASGDTFYNIARRYDTTATAIQSANPGLNSRSLSIGQTINLPPRTR